MPELQLGDTTVEYAIVRSRRRSIAATILSDGTLAVKAPVLIPEFIIRQFLKSKADWIVKHIERRKKLGNKQLVSEKQEYVNFFDTRMKLQITEAETAKKTRLYRVNNSFQIILPTNLTPSKREKEIQRVIHDWYKHNILTELVRRVDHYAPIVGVKYNNIRIKNVKGHWGSCSIDRNLNFNYRLGMLPVELSDYVIIHELCHIIEMNHSDKFWNLVQTFVPDYKALRKELKTYHFL
jgi:predicted metal-dependent hydrolase